MCREPATAGDVRAAMPHPVAGSAADPIALEPVDEVAVTTLAGNVYDALLTSDDSITRAPLAAGTAQAPQFEPGRTNVGLMAGHGFSALVDWFMFDTFGSQALQKSVESGNGEGDPARARPGRVRLNEERGVLVDVPEDLSARAHVRRTPKEPCVPIDRSTQLGYRDTSDEVDDCALHATPVTP